MRHGLRELVEHCKRPSIQQTWRRGTWPLWENGFPLRTGCIPRNHEGLQGGLHCLPSGLLGSSFQRELNVMAKQVRSHEYSILHLVASTTRMYLQ